MELKAERVEQLSCGRCGQAMSPAAHKPLSVIKCPRCRHRVVVPASFGDFLITGVLGQGGAGIVCKATDRRLHRQVAIKVLKTGDESADLVEACTREARAMAALNHPNVVQVHNIGEHRGQPFIVMELLEGGSVEKVMLGKPAHERDALDIAIGVAEGLQAAAAAGMVHMDVKPSNILFDRQKNAKLIDFGVARFARGSSEEIVGTPYYVAPEVVRGKAADVQADIYSLGATLFHLLSGAAPFEGKNATEVITKRLREPAPNLLDLRADLSGETVRVVARMLEANPAHRHASYAQLIEDLRQARQTLDVPEEQRALGELANAVAAPAADSTLSASGVSVARSTTISRGIIKEQPRRRGLVAAVIGGALALTVLGVMLAMQLGDRESQSVAARAKADSSVPTATQPPPFVEKPSWIASSPEWTVLEPIAFKARGGAVLSRQADNSLLVSGPHSLGEQYTIDVNAPAGTITAFAIETMADASLPRYGPGRNEGKFVLSEVDVLSGPDAGDLSRVVLQSARAEYAQKGFEVGGVVDSNPKTGWAIFPHVAVPHVLTLQSAAPVTGDTLRFVLTHHPDYAASIGRMRFWVKREASASAAERPPAAKQAGKGKKAAGEPAPPPQVAAHGPNNFGALYLNTALVDAKLWHTLDIRQAQSTGGAKMKRLEDGSILVEQGPIAADDTYTLTVLTKLRNITGFRLDALPDDSLAKGGPGREGVFQIAEVSIEASAGDGSGKMKVPLVSPTATVQPKAAGGPFDDDAATLWSNEGAIGKAATLTVKTATPVNFDRETLLTITIRHAASLPLGRLQLAATTAADPAKIKSAEIVLQQPRYLNDFIPLTIHKVTSAEGVEAKITQGGYVSVPGGPANDVYTIEATMNVPQATALRLEALIDDETKRGPGKGVDNNLAIAEVTVEAAAGRGKKAAAGPVQIRLGQPTAQFNDAKAALMVDGNDRTHWSATGVRSQKQTFIFPFAEPAVGSSTKLTITLAQPAAMVRFRLTATASTDPQTLGAKK